jgi:hypothetical protein
VSRIFPVMTHKMLSINQLKMSQILNNEDFGARSPQFL